MNELIEKFLPYEKDLFFALNGSDSLFLDNLMWVYTSIFTWIPMVAFILFIAFKNQKLKVALLVLAALGLVVLFSDQLSSSFFKPLFKRYRPSRHPEYMHLVDVVKGYRGGRYGFISGHATNSFGVAVFLSLLFKNRFVTGLIIFWALINSYSRIYLGVHFISDIFAGFIFGALIGLLVYKIYTLARNRFLNIPISENAKSIYTVKDCNTLSIGMASYIVLIIIMSPLLVFII